MEAGKLLQDAVRRTQSNPLHRSPDTDWKSLPAGERFYHRHRDWGTAGTVRHWGAIFATSVAVENGLSYFGRLTSLSMFVILAACLALSFSAGWGAIRVHAAALLPPRMYEATEKVSHEKSHGVLKEAIETAYSLKSELSKESRCQRDVR